MKRVLHQAVASTGDDKLSFFKLESIFGDLDRTKEFNKEFNALSCARPGDGQKYSIANHCDKNGTGFAEPGELVCES